MISKGEIIGYAGDAVLYDEQPRSLKQSYNQRLRWAKGFYQVFARYGKALFNGMMKGSFSCYDMLMTVLPSMLLTLASMVVTLILFVYSLIAGGTDYQLFQLIGALAFTFLSFYGMFFALGLITLITEWEMIHAPTKKKIIYLFGFPIYLFTYIPIAIIALFKKVEWKPIKHEVSKDIGDLIKK